MIAGLRATRGAAARRLPVRRARAHPERATLPLASRVAIAAALSLTVSTLHAGLFGWLFHRDMEVITSTNASPAGALLRPASPTHPVFYQAISVGYRDFGAAVAGDKPPIPRDLDRVVVKVLAKAGFLPADAKHPPTELIVFAWGTMNPDLIPNLAHPDMPDVQLNRTSMLRFLGGDKLGLIAQQPDEWLGPPAPGLAGFDPDARAIENVARKDLYVVALAGYAFPDKRSPHPKLLWQTKISCPSVGLAMKQALPAMLAIAAPQIGHVTSRPVWGYALRNLKPNVEIGNPKFEEYLNSGQWPILKTPPAPSKSKGKKR